MKNVEELSRLIKSVLTAQRFAVLATQSDGQPYSNLIAFAESDELRKIIFVTSRDTRKYSNAKVNNRVAVLIDSRTNQASDLQTAVAITALGTIGEVDRGARNHLSELYVLKHPLLADFIDKPSNALMQVMVTDYIVATFEGVTYLSMSENI